MTCGYFHSEVLSGETDVIMLCFIFNTAGCSDEGSALLVGTCHIYRFYQGITKEGIYSIVVIEFLISFLCSNLMQVLDISQLRLVTLHT